MGAQVQSRPDASDRTARRRRVQRVLVANVPTIVWLGAVAAVAVLEWRTHRTSLVTGYGESPPVVLAHSEPGCVRAVHVRLFDFVRPGQVLISLDDTEERILLMQVEKDLERVRAEVLATATRMRFESARTAVDVQDVTRQFATDRETTRIDYLSQLVLDAKDRVQARWFAAEAEIVRGLCDAGSASPRELNEIQAAVESLRVAIEQNVDVIARKRAAFEASDRRWAEYLRHEPVENDLETALAPLRLAEDVRQRDLENLVRRIDQHVLRAPVDGQVTFLAVQDGDSVSAGVPLVEITTPSTNRIVAYIPETSVSTIASGMRVTVRPATTPNGSAPFMTGVVSSLSAAITEAPVRHRLYPTAPLYGRGFTVTLDDGQALRTGERAEIYLEP
jgi:multidrug resistance efflux pump